MLTVQWQPLTPDLGAEIPDAVVAAGCGDLYERALDRSRDEYERLRDAGHAEAAPYALCLGYRIRYVLDLNAREAMHLTELRSAREGHASYRAVAQAMHAAIAERPPGGRRDDEARRPQHRAAPGAHPGRDPRRVAPRAAHARERARRGPRGAPSGAPPRSSSATPRRCSRCTTPTCASRRRAARSATATRYIAGNTEGDLVWRGQQMSDGRRRRPCGDTAVLTALVRHQLERGGRPGSSTTPASR